MSRNRSFKFLSSQCIKDLKKIKLKERTLAKVNWAGNAYGEWHQARLEEEYVESIFNANLSDVKSLKKEQLEDALCYFIPEVTKAKGQGLYQGHTSIRSSSLVGGPRNMKSMWLPR